MIARNFADAITVPKDAKKKKSINAFNPDEQAALLKNLSEHRLFALFVAALGTGLRIGELLALRWECTDTELHEIKVKEAVKRTKNRNNDGSLTDKEDARSSL